VNYTYNKAQAASYLTSTPVHEGVSVYSNHLQSATHVADVVNAAQASLVYVLLKDGLQPGAFGPSW
jgi:hypothetical protein